MNIPGFDSASEVEFGSTGGGDGDVSCVGGGGVALRSKGGAVVWMGGGSVTTVVATPEVVSVPV